MIDGLEYLLAGTGQEGLPELRTYLAEMFADQSRAVAIIDVEMLLRSRVFRVRFGLADGERSLVIKRMSPELAYRERRLLERWLPHIGLDRCGPPLIGSVAERSGRCIWHIYEYLGQRTLNGCMDDKDAVMAATNMIGRLHADSMERPVLAECRALGNDFGTCFYLSSVRDAMRILEVLRSAHIEIRQRQQEMVDRLLRRLDSLMLQQTHLEQMMAELSGPEVLLHGDLWTTNIFALPGDESVTVRLIDWDHVGVGPVTYDLSTYLFRFPAQRRKTILDWYRDETAHVDWAIPSPSQFNFLCETAECARLANAVIWPALSACKEDGSASWAFDELAEIERWFEGLEPILPSV